MSKPLTIISMGALFMFLIIAGCTEKKTNQEVSSTMSAALQKTDYNGFESQEALGEHLTIIAGCHDCHTPKKMTNHGPVLDTALWLSGHPANMPRIDIDRKEIESKGLGVTMDLTEWVGPWGISFSANLTPDGTGIGNWSEEQFIYAIRNGKAKGLADSRPLLPPMPWEMIKHMTDLELKAIYAYLQSIAPINNLVPDPVPPTGMGS